ncbi:aldo/keto reductase [Candidatus Roizmanbacteria bacterium]|nr:aldo/keto reductase [Candidatus Roizmanbacteria bacterium]
MKIPTKKLKNGFKLPVFGLGTWQIGGKFRRDPHNDDKGDIQAIRQAIKMGITHIDTAERYANGHAEELVGQAIKGFDRKKLIITTKVSPEHLKYEDLLQSCKKSLKRLHTAYIDLFLIHAPNPDVSIKETMKAMDMLKKDGLIKNIGVSNFNTQHLREAQGYTNNEVMTNQVIYNLLARSVDEEGLLGYCQNNDIFLTAYRPVEQGLLTKENEPLMKTMCDKYDKTPAQIAINWLISQDNIVTICKMSKTKHLKENLGAIGWYMENEDIQKLKKEFPRDRSIEAEFPVR